MSESSTAHLTPQTGLVPALNAWEIYLNDQGRSLNTVKAFLSDVRLLTQVLPPDRTAGRHYHQRPETASCAGWNTSATYPVRRKAWRGVSPRSNRFSAGCTGVAPSWWTRRKR